MENLMGILYKTLRCITPFFVLTSVPLCFFVLCCSNDAACLYGWWKRAVPLWCDNKYGIQRLHNSPSTQSMSETPLDDEPSPIYDKANERIPVRILWHSVPYCKILWHSACLISNMMSVCILVTTDLNVRENVWLPFLSVNSLIIFFSHLLVVISLTTDYCTCQ